VIDRNIYDLLNSLSPNFFKMVDYAREAIDIASNVIQEFIISGIVYGRIYVGGYGIRFIDGDRIAKILRDKPRSFTRLIELIHSLINTIPGTLEPSVVTSIEVEPYRDPEEGYESIIVRMCLKMSPDKILSIWSTLSNKLMRETDGTDFFLELLPEKLCSQIIYGYRV